MKIKVTDYDIQGLPKVGDVVESRYPLTTKRRTHNPITGTGVVRNWTAEFPAGTLFKVLRVEVLWVEYGCDYEEPKMTAKAYIETLEEPFEGLELDIDNISPLPFKLSKAGTALYGV